MKRRRCSVCRMMTAKWQRINGSRWHCWDGCKSTTGYDHRPILKYSTSTDEYKEKKEAALKELFMNHKYKKGWDRLEKVLKKHE